MMLPLSVGDLDQVIFINDILHDICLEIFKLKDVRQQRI